MNTPNTTPTTEQQTPATPEQPAATGQPPVDKPVDQPTNDDKPVEGKPEEKEDDGTQTGAPETYEFAVPEGFESLDEKLIEQFSPIAKKLNLTQEQAQELVNLYAGSIKTQQDTYVEQMAGWADQVKKDPEIGGAKFQESIVAAQKVITKYGSNEFKDFLNKSGLGNHPELIKMFAKVGKDFSEDSFVPPAGAEKKEKTAAEMLYPNQK